MSAAGARWHHTDKHDNTGGLNPFPFHLANTLVHALNSCLVFRWAFAINVSVVYSRSAEAVAMIITDTHPQASSVTGRFALTWRRTSISSWSASHRPRQQQRPSSMAADSGSLHSCCAVCCASHSYRGCGRCSWPCRAGECCISAAGSHGVLVSSQSSGLEAALQDAGCVSHHAVVRCTCQGAWHHHGEHSPIYSGNDIRLRPFYCNPRCCYSTAAVVATL